MHRISKNYLNESVVTVVTELFEIMKKSNLPVFRLKDGGIGIKMSLSFFKKRKGQEKQTVFIKSRDCELETIKNSV